MWPIPQFLRIRLDLLIKSLMETFIFCAVQLTDMPWYEFWGFFPSNFYFIVLISR